MSAPRVFAKSMISLRVVLRRERGGRVVEVRPLEEQLHREVGPRFAAVTGDELELGEEPAHLVDVRDVLRLVRDARPRNARGGAERHVELNALHVDRIELLVVDRDLRVQAGGERVHALEVVFLGRLVDLAQRLHAFVGIDVDAREEPVGVLAQGPLRRTVVGRDDRLPDVVPVELGEEDLDGVVHVLGLPLGNVLEHVARGEFELAAFLARAVARLLADEPVELVHLLARLREADGGVDRTARLGGIECCVTHAAATSGPRAPVRLGPTVRASGSAPGS